MKCNWGCNDNISCFKLVIGSSNGAGAIIGGVSVVIVIIIVIAIVTVCIRLHYNKGMSLSIFPPLTRNLHDNLQ